MWSQTHKYKNARTGILHTRHGKIDTPAFMPVATAGAVKYLSSVDLKNLGYQLVLSNTYHLMLRPGIKLIKQQGGGLHQFMAWPGAILTDSGGFQVFSLQGRRGANPASQVGGLVKLSDKGVKFQSPYDGSWQELTPAKAVKLQADLGVDIAVCLDECVKLPVFSKAERPAFKKYLVQSVALTTKWAKQSKIAWQALKDKHVLSGAEGLFAVIQGGLDKALRLKSLRDLVNIGFDGYNIGGLSVGESAKQMYGVLDYLVQEMPADKPRYLMGVGKPENILEAVKRGVDLFDCVIPTREGRHGRLFVWQKSRQEKLVKYLSQTKISSTDFYKTLNINNAQFANDKTMINKNSQLPELRAYSKAYLRHLFKINEPLGQRLATLNNLEFYSELMQTISQAIKKARV